MQGHAPLLAVFPPADGVTNFARDTALLEVARQTGAECVRVYGWDRPVLSFGRNERVLGRYDRDRLQKVGLSVVRRPTGGRALLHDRELTYAVAGPATPSGSLRATYERWSAILQAALSHMGVVAERAAARAAQATDGTPCFATPSAGEIIVEGRKLIASAQWREAGAFVQHGSLLIDNDQSRLADALVIGQQLPPLPEPATLRALLGRAPSREEFADALARAITVTTGVAPARVSSEELVPDACSAPHRARFDDPAWTWRR